LFLIRKPSTKGDGSVLRLGYGKYSRIVQASLTDFTPLGGKQNPCSRRCFADSTGDRFSSNQGKGVTLNIKDEQEMEIAYNEARKYSRVVLVEKYVKGKDYRVLVVGDRVAAVAERRPPFAA